MNKSGTAIGNGTASQTRRSNVETMGIQESSIDAMSSAKQVDGESPLGNGSEFE
jgi:hypothetical protein